MASVVSRSFVTCPSAKMTRMWYCDAGAGGGASVSAGALAAAPPRHHRWGGGPLCVGAPARSP